MLTIILQNIPTRSRKKSEMKPPSFRRIPARITDPAVGERLDLPIKLAQVPEHLYCVYDDPDGRFNVEATSDAHLGINSDEILKRRCSPEHLNSDSCVRVLTRREILGLFIRLRAEVWMANGELEKALTDFQRSHELFPKDLIAWRGVQAAVARISAERNPNPRKATPKPVSPPPLVRRQDPGSRIGGGGNSPLGPKKAKDSPGAISKSKGLSACTLP